MSSVPALTTTFVPSPSCTVDIYMESFSTGLICAVGTQIVPCNYYHLGVDSSTSDCLPSGWASSTGAYFSPGICPSGYTQACQNVTGSETRATCCPTGFDQVLVYTTSILGEGNAVFTSTEDNQGINAFGIEIRYQSTDFASSSSTATSAASASATGQSTGSGSSSSASPSGTGNSSSDSSGHSSSSSSGLSTGAKAGIGIGVALGVLALLGIFIFLVVRKRRAAATAAGDGDGDGLGGALDSEGNMASMSGGPTTGDHRASSMASPGSGIAYTAVSTGSPAPEQQKYYSADSTAVPPMAEAPTDAPWTMPAELPAETPQRY
ncbi:MAG: hypothetical protein SEPTF4163_000391 [Sporothrix epigloea]